MGGSRRARIGGSRRALWAGLMVGCAVPDPTPTPAPTPAPLRFALPFAEPSQISTLVGVDHDPEVHDDTLGDLVCRNYADEPFPTCYDEHRGSDFILDGGFDAMDAGSVLVLAAADGVVEAARDDQYDRCHSEDFTVTCDGHPIVPNLVVLRHEGGVTTRYLHLMQDSLAVAVGDSVVCGQPLALVGSSGRSSTPHLHFEVRDADDAVIDPYAGVRSQPESWWREQDGPLGMPSLACGEDDR